MKVFNYLVVLLVLLLAAPVVWAGQVGHTVDMPEYLTANVSVHSPIVAVHCRDVNHVHNLLYTKQIGADAITFYTLRTQTWKKAGNLLAGITGYINHKGAAVLTDRTVFSRWQSADTVVFAGKIDNYNKSLDPTEDPALIKLDFTGPANHKEAVLRTGIGKVVVA